MASNAQRRRFFCQKNRLIESRRVRHERGRSNSARRGSFYNSTVHPGGHPEVVSIYDQPAHEGSLTVSSGRAIGVIERFGSTNTRSDGPISRWPDNPIRLTPSL